MMKTQLLFSLLLVLVILGLMAFTMAIHFQSTRGTEIFVRHPGGSVGPIRWAAGICNASDPLVYRYGACSIFIDCVLSNLNPVMTIDLNTGTTLVGLLPTILILLAPDPMDLVELGLIAPHRALAIASFSIGLPKGLFARLAPIQSNGRGVILAGNAASGQRVWTPSFAALSPTCSWKHVITKAVADAIIVVCTCIMLWRSWLVNNWVMVQWKCESPLMTFTWPIGCMAWMVIALLLLGAMSEEIRFENFTDPSIQYTWWDVLGFPYSLGFVEKPSSSSSQALHDYRIRIVVKMPQQSHWRSWLVYETVLELLSGALYFYSTMVLLSSVFLGGVGAMTFVGQVVGTYVAVRVLSGLL